MANPFVHVELNTTDPKKAETFYSHLFEWKLEPMAMDKDTYTLIKVGDGTGGVIEKPPWRIMGVVDGTTLTYDPAVAMGPKTLKRGELVVTGLDNRVMPLVRFRSDDLVAATKKSKSLGATVMKDVTEVPGMGWFSIIVDPTGAALGLWKPMAM